MAERFVDRLEHAWNAFRGRDTTPPRLPHGGQVSYGFRPDRHRSFGFNKQQIITPIINQISIDVAGVEMRHIKTGDDDEYRKNMPSELNNTFNVSPNLDQGPSQFRQDVAMTLMEEGTIAIVPVETDLNPNDTGGWDVKQLRVGTIRQWYPKHVRVDLYNQELGIREELVLPKMDIAIVENPLYSVMNDPNSTLQRLQDKLRKLDVTDDRLASGKLDIILQLPYTIKHETRLREADQRLGDLASQVRDNPYGIGYIDSTERITQLNRPSENNLLEQVKMLETRLYTQLGLTEEIFYGTADEAAMLNYQNRTVFPIVRAIQEEYHRKFLTRTARSRNQAIRFFRDPFSLVPVGQIAEIADKFTRNEIMSPNEFRPKVGMRPVDDPEANELRNRNMPKVDTEGKPSEAPEQEVDAPEPPEPPPRRTLKSRREQQNEA